MEDTSVCTVCGAPLVGSECPDCAKTLNAPFAAAFPKIQGYRIISPLGQGGMGEVYLAEDESLGRRVAVKVISGKFAREEESQARFIREARAMATVEHPHIVRVYSFGSLQDKTFLVMEYVEGENLAERVQRFRQLPVEEALSLSRDVVDALEAAWEKQIIHRDIKPSNILLDKKNRVRVADFGLAKPMQVASDSSLTHAGYLLGTPHYVSPEQAGGQPVDFRSDIYSLGIVLYEMLTGQLPFTGTTPFAIVAKHLNDPLPPIREKRSDVSPAVVRLVEWMTAKDPADRPGSHAALAQAIESLLTTTPGRAYSTIEALQAPRVPVSKRRKAALAGVAGVVLVATGLIWWSVSKPDQKERVSVPGESRMVVAVTPFYGPDEDSAKEGRLMAALVEKAIHQRLGSDVKILGIDQTKEPVRSHESARELGERVGANAVIWGEAFALRKETEIQPSFTMIRRASEGASESKAKADVDASLALSESPAAMRVEAEAPNQIELRKTSASGLGDLVLFLAGQHALQAERNAEKALRFFSQAPPGAESRRQQAQALLQLKRKPEAMAALEQSLALDPRNVSALALLADLRLEEGQFADAAAAYKRAADLGQPHTTRNAFFSGGRLYVRETFRSEKYTRGEPANNGYLIAVEPESRRVLERHRLPGIIQSFSVKQNTVEIACSPRDEASDLFTMVFSNGTFDRPIFYGGNLLLRVRGMKSGRALVANFMDDLDSVDKQFMNPKFAPTKAPYEDAPATFADAEATLRAALEKDPTQPWHPFFLGQVLWAAQRRGEAERIWSDFLARPYAGVPYYEFAFMSKYFERLGQRKWADVAYGRSLERRREIPQPIDFSTLIERLINVQFIRQPADFNSRSQDLERAHLLLSRARELSGITQEGDDLIAAAWGKYFRDRGEIERATREAAVFKRSQNLPLNFLAHAARMDYSLSLLLGMLLSFGISTVLLISKGWQSARVLAQVGPARKWSWSIPRPLKIIGIPIAILFLLWVALLGVFAETATKTVVVHLAGVVALLLVSGILSLGTAANIDRQERIALAVTFTAMVMALVLMANVFYRFTALQSIPIGLSDSQGHATIIQEFEKRLTKYSSPELQFAAAVTNHLGGNRERARELYESLGRSGQVRAQQGLQALEQGRLPEPLTATELYRALLAGSWKDFLGGRRWPLHVVLGLVLLVILFLVPPVKTVDLAPPGGRTKRTAAKIGFFLVPGTFDLRRGSPLWGVLLLSLFCFAAVAFGLRLAGGDAPGSGVFSSMSLPNLAAQPLPFVQGEPIMAQHYWTFFWTYPYAKLYWSAVALAAAVALLVHLSRAPAIRRLYAAPGQLQDREERDR